MENPDYERLVIIYRILISLIREWYYENRHNFEVFT